MRDCFIVMPIGSGDAYDVYLNRYDQIIRPAVEGVRDVGGDQVFRCTRADFVTQTGSITQDVLTRLYGADAVIADMTDLNPNVFYELGVRHALRSGTILLALKGTKPPFDVGDLRIIFFEDRVGAEKTAIPQIQEMLKALIKDGAPADSPVLRTIPQLLSAQAAREMQGRIVSLEQEATRLRAQLDISERSTLVTQGTMEALRQAVDLLTSRLPAQERQAAETQIESAARSQYEARRPRRPVPASAKTDPRAVFVLMPFRQEFEDVYAAIKEAIDETGLRGLRADELTGSGVIIEQIFEMISGAGLIIADLSDRNQNVMYELGVANAMQKETMLLSQDLNEVPFDLRMYRVLMYERSVKGLTQLRLQLRKALDEYRRRRGIGGA